MNPINDDAAARVRELHDTIEIEKLHGPGPEDFDEDTGIRNVVYDPKAFYMDAGDILLPETVDEAGKVMDSLRDALEWLEKSMTRGDANEAWALRDAQILTRRAHELGERILLCAYANGYRAANFEERP